MNTPKTPGPVHCPLQTEHVVQSSNCEISNNWRQSFENHKRVSDMFIIYGVFNDAASKSWIGQSMKWTGRGLSRHLFGGTKKRHENCQSG
jgi:hypothetical protein